jgi:hypothetical protein
MTVLDQTPQTDPLLFHIVTVNDPALRHGLARVHEQITGTLYEVVYLDGGQRAEVDAQYLTITRIPR